VNRRERHGAILRLVREQPISTQTELAEALRAAGYDVVQTTVSRDIHELGLVKVRDDQGRRVYAPPGATDADGLRALARAVRRFALSFEAAGNMVVITTPDGFATPLADAIDDSGHPHVAGTIAGENTIFVVARDGTPALQLRDELRTHLALAEGAA
jgi:transcriptional regulator of arginine metabolism